MLELKYLSVDIKLLTTEQETFLNKNFFTVTSYTAHYYVIQLVGEELSFMDSYHFLEQDFAITAQQFIQISKLNLTFPILANQLFESILTEANNSRRNTDV